MHRLLFALLLVAIPTWGQQSSTGNLTAQGTVCASATVCVTLALPANQGGAGFTLAGTWSGTVQFEASADGGATYQAINATPSNSTTAVTSATANGVWQANVAGFTHVRIRCSTFSSGTIVATINGSSASARTNGSGGATPTLDQIGNPVAVKTFTVPNADLPVTFTDSGVFTSAAYNNNYIFSLTGGSSCTNSASYKNTEAMQVCVSTPASGVTNALTVGYSSWVYANDPTQDGTNPVSADITAVGGRFSTYCNVSHTYCYGSNPQANDVSGKTDTHVIGEEIDVAANNTTTVGFALTIGTFGTAQPTGDNLPAIAVTDTTGGASKFTTGFECVQAGVLAVSGNAPCVKLNELASGNPANSQALEFHARNGSGTDFPLDIFTTYNANSNTPLLTESQSYSQVLTTIFSRNTAQTSGNITITGWGSGAAVSAVSGYAQRFVFTITAGTTPSANPTFSATFSDAMPFAPICIGIQQQADGTGALLNVARGTETNSATGTMTVTGTPVSTLTYEFVIDCRL